MALIIPPGFAQIAFELQLTNDDEPIITTLGLDLDAVAGTQIADLAFQAFALEIMPVVSNAYTLVRATAYVGNDGPGPLVYDSSLTGVTGANTGNPLPQNCAWLMRKRTDLAGRRGRGRMYIPGVMESEVSPTGVIDTTTVTGLQAAADDFYDRLTTGVDQAATPPVVLHRSEGIGEEPAPTPITSFTVDSVIATQRRRLRP